MSFYKNGELEGKTGPSGDWYLLEWGRYKERVRG
jgi:hypothetical protein